MGAMTDLFSAISKLRVLGFVMILSVSANCNRNTEEAKEREINGGINSRCHVSGTAAARSLFLSDEIKAAAAEREHFYRRKSKPEDLILIKTLL